MALKMVLLYDKNGQSFFKILLTYFFFYFVPVSLALYWEARDEDVHHELVEFGQKVIQRAKGAALLHAILSSGTYCDLIQKKKKKCDTLKNFFFKIV